MKDAKMKLCKYKQDLHSLKKSIYKLNELIAVEEAAVEDFSKESNEALRKSFDEQSTSVERRIQLLLTISVCKSNIKVYVSKLKEAAKKVKSFFFSDIMKKKQTQVVYGT